MKRARSVWHDLESSPEEADDLAERAELMIKLQIFFEGLDPSDVASRYGVDPSVAADILAGRIDQLPQRVLRDFMGAIVTAEGPLSTPDS